MSQTGNSGAGSPQPDTALNEAWKLIRESFTTLEQCFQLGTYRFTRASDLAGTRISEWRPVLPPLPGSGDQS